MKKPSKRLELRRTTLKTLTQVHLDGAVGGMIFETFQYDSCRCPSWRTEGPECYPVE